MNPERRDRGEYWTFEKADPFSPKLCPFCGTPDYKTHDVAGHVQTYCCGNIVSSCCEGPIE